MANFEVPAREYMSSPLEAVREDEPLDAVYRRLVDLGYSALPVIDGDGSMVGLLSRTDLLRIGGRQANTRPGSPLLVFPDRTAGQEMTPDPETASIADPLSRVAALMLEGRHHRIFLEEEGKSVGVVTTRDLMRAIAEKRVNHSLSAHMSSPLFTVRASEPVSLATERLDKARVTGLVVVDGKWPVGVFTQTEALEARHVRRETPVEDVMSVAILLLDEAMPLYRAAAQAAAVDVRRIVATRKNDAVGIVTGLDFARVVA